MKHSSLYLVTCFLSTVLILSSCRTEQQLAGVDSWPPLPQKIIDLSPVITEDLPVRIWGHKLLSDFGFRDTNEFEYVITENPLYAMNSYSVMGDCACSRRVYAPTWPGWFSSELERLRSAGWCPSDP